MTAHSGRCHIAGRGFAAMLASLVLAGPAHAQRGTPTIDIGPDAEVTYDGLYRVNRSVLDEAWAKPYLDLMPYAKIMLVLKGIAYREVRDPGSSARARETATEFPIGDESRARLEQTLREEFVEEFEKVERYEIVAEPGQDVLTLEIELIDVVSHVPPETMGRGDIYLRDIGEATLVLELRDSISREILARAVDRRTARFSRPQEANSVSSWAEVRSLAKSWAAVLRQRFDSVTEIRVQE